MGPVASLLVAVVVAGGFVLSSSSSRRPHASPVPLPSAMGPHETTTSSFYVGGFVAGGNQDAYLVLPKDYATAPPGSYPLVAFAHGCCKNSVNQSASDYNSVFVHLASHGMVVASYNTCLGECNMVTFADDQKHLVAALHADPSLHPVLDKVDFTRVGLLGHSMGGGATVFSAAKPQIVHQETEEESDGEGEAVVVVAGDAAAAAATGGGGASAAQSVEKTEEV